METKVKDLFDVLRVLSFQAIKSETSSLMIFCHTQLVANDGIQCKLNFKYIPKG